MKKKITSAFMGNVYSIHLYVGGHEIPLINSGSSNWTGKHEVDIVGDTVKIELKFIAPSFSDWELIVKFGGKDALKDSGTSEAANFSYSKTIDSDPKPIKKSETRNRPRSI